MLASQQAHTQEVFLNDLWIQKNQTKNVPETRKTLLIQK